MDGHGVAGVAYAGDFDLIMEGEVPKGATVVLIRPGMSKNRLKWTAPVLRQASEAGIFDGVKMFRDHNRKNPLERSLNELVAGIRGTTVGQQGEVVGDVKFLNEGFASFAQKAKEHIGTSVVVAYEGERGRDSHGPFIEPKKITKAVSVDWVAFPAGDGTGIVNFAQESFTMEWSEEDITALKKARPELFAQESQEGAPPVDVKAIAEEAAKQVSGAIKDAVATAVRETQQQLAQEAEERQATSAAIDAYLKGVALPATTKVRIRAQFDGSREYKEPELKLAVESAKAEIDEALKAAGHTGPRITGAGVSGSTAEGEAVAVSAGSSAAADAVANSFGLTGKPPAKKE